MKKTFLPLLAATALAACQPATNSIQLRFNDNGTFKVAQFTDMHFVDGSPNSAKTEATIRYVLETEKPDVAILTDDQEKKQRIPTRATGKPRRKRGSLRLLRRQIQIDGRNCLGASAQNRRIA
jgi:hypothetical protein